MTKTPLEHAHEAAENGGDAERLRFFDTFISAELFLLLKSEPNGDQIEPDVFDTDDGSFLLAFDREEALSDFVGRSAPYVSLSGRALIEMINGSDIGVALNPGASNSSQLFPPNIVAWLADNFAETPQEVETHPLELLPPDAVPEALLIALDQKLASLTGLARLAYLTQAVYETHQSHLLAIIDPTDGAEDAISKSIAQTLAFSGIEAGSLDVAFFDFTDPIAAQIAKVGLRFDLPEPEERTPTAAPGSIPGKPPKLV